MKMSEAFPSNYLKASDLEDDTTVVIADIKIEDIGDDRKPVLYFQGEKKGLVLNKTNATALANTFGDESDDWIGHEIILFSMPVTFEGRTVDAIRVRVPKKRVVQPSAAKSFHTAGGTVTTGRQARYGDDDLPEPRG